MIIYNYSKEPVEGLENNKVYKAHYSNKGVTLDNIDISFMPTHIYRCGNAEAYVVLSDERIGHALVLFKSDIDSSMLQELLTYYKSDKLY